MNRYLQALVATGVLVASFGGDSYAQSETFGSNNLYYNRQYNSGQYTNPGYENQYFSFNDFYTNLAPYGQWIEDQHYGFVWSPDVESDFRPYYTNGRWAQTDYGNTWVSDYNWGWACFHYGRWIFDSYYGWLWVPGSTWGPAWVSWRAGAGSFGWAPLSPDYELTMESGSELKAYRCPRDWWVFLPYKYIYGGDYYSYLTGPQGNTTVFATTTVADNTYTNNGNVYVGGPTFAQMEKVSEVPVKMYHINNAGTPRVPYIHNELIKLFKPAEIKPHLATGEQPVPPAVINAPRRITTEMQAVNATSGIAPAFKKDLPNLLATQVYTPLPSQYTNVNNQAKKAENVIRADKNVYHSEVLVPDAQRPKQQQGSPFKKPLKTLPAQAPQEPEPVVITNKREEMSTTVRQHNDPLPSIPQQDKPQSQAIPSQHPEPIPPAGDR